MLACLSGMAGHALYGMAPCFGHTGVTFDAENNRPGPCSLQCHFEATRGRFLRLKALVLLEVFKINVFYVHARQMMPVA